MISDDVYRKIHLTRADFVKKKEAKDKAKDAAGHEHEHEHEHDHDGVGSLPPSPAATLEQLKKTPAGKEVRGMTARLQVSPVGRNRTRADVSDHFSHCNRLAFARAMLRGTKRTPMLPR